MGQIKYDFSGLEHAIVMIKKSERNANCLNNLKKELNKFFEDSICTDVIYTKNTDKPFFGMCVYPDLTYSETAEIITGSEDMRINRYIIEIDSKLFDPLLALTDKELTAIVLHEVGHLVNDAYPVRRLRKEIDKYQHDTRKPLKLKQLTGEGKASILTAGVKDALRKITSIFENEEIAADEFVYMCGYGEYLESALRKLKTQTGIQMKNIATNQFIVLSWSLKLYTDLGVNRIPAIHHLNKASRITGSELEKKSMLNLKKQLEVINKYDFDADEGKEQVLEATYITENKLSEVMIKMKYKGIKAFRDDYYEYFMQARNIEDEDDAIVLIRQINTRIAILTEFLEEQGDTMKDKERKELFNMIDLYTALREKIANKATYRTRGSMGNLIINYPEIQDCRR